MATSTGTGWIDSAAPKSLELMYGGNTAFVTTQYSYLPSWISFLLDRPRADAEGRGPVRRGLHAACTSCPRTIGPSWSSTG